MRLRSRDKGAWGRGVELVAATGAAALIGLLIFLALPAPTYVARWDARTVTVSKDGRSVNVIVLGRSCDDSVLFEIAQSDEHVRVTAVVTQHRLRPCGEEPVLRSYAVPLGRPLGERPLLDGRCSREDADALAQADCPAQPVVPRRD